MPASNSRRRWLLALVLLAPLVLCAWWLWRRAPEAPSHFDAALDRSIEPVLELHAAETKLGMASAGQTRLLARQLALDSIPYLTAADLELWAAVRLEVASRSPAACARSWRGADDAFLAQAVAALGEERLRAWTDMLARGLAIRLERKPPPLPAPHAMARGLAEIAAALPAPERASFTSDTTRAAVGDERACQLFLALSKGAQKLEPSLRTDLYRALARQLRSSSPRAAPPEPR